MACGEHYNGQTFTIHCNNILQFIFSCNNINAQSINISNVSKTNKNKNINDNNSLLAASSKGINLLFTLCQVEPTSSLA